jgi:two-component system LytT family sensor kinase
MTSSGAHRWLKVLWVFGLCTFIGLTSAGQFYYSNLALETPVAWSRAWRASLTDWYILALLYFGAAFVSQRFPLERPFRFRNVAIHIGCSGLFSVTHLAAYVLVRAMVFPSDHFAFVESFNWWFARRFHGNLIYYWTFVIAAHALHWYQRLRERELKAAELEARLAETKLAALKAQLEPHFLFNTLNTIAELVHDDPNAAEQTLTRLSDLLRLSLKASGEKQVSLQEEIAFVEPYLDIQRLRMGSRLAVCWEIDPNALPARVPNLLLQPIIENAIKHGIGPLPDGGTITVTARCDNGQLTIAVRDTGAGITSHPDGSVKEGVGLSNLKTRLNCLYGTRHQFSLRNLPQGGCELSVCLPLHTNRAATTE